MDEQSKNTDPGHAAGTYPLSRLTRTLPSLTTLQAFMAAAHYGSISKAATHLCRTQGAVSRQIQQLEGHYQCCLFTRGAAGLALTSQGHALQPVVTQVLDLLVRQEELLRRAAPVLTLRVPSTFAIAWLLPRLDLIQAALGSTELRIITSADDTPDFGAPDIDAIIVRGTGNWPALESTHLFRETLTPMCTPALAARLGSRGELGAARLLHPGPGGAEWRSWLERLGVNGVEPRRGLVFDTQDLMLSAAAQGHGVAIADPRLAAERLANGTLTMPFSEQVDNGASYFLLCPPRRAQNPDMHALTAALLALIGN
ncbi:MAG TPA: LysR family transcriptional regulator [Janthinobacterium sp.]|nr:LysR family transcriptional regulator [Janthinobacterium sp.]